MNIYITNDDMCTTQKLNLARVQNWFIKNECTIVDDVKVADHILCMTCNGWKLLEDNSYNRIKELSDYHDKTIVMGCVVDAHEEKVDKIFKGNKVTTRSKSSSFEVLKIFFLNLR